jgi:hypothetical protein
MVELEKREGYYKQEQGIPDNDPALKNVVNNIPGKF